ncbi:hypothetical protein Noda2021_10750 [Candidatus Dependentiae bacterium Noda2021]|nr:hypothetical protein Noda2021_10750 [Candidatus Dependentiae bacterium Noda2021]
MVSIIVLFFLSTSFLAAMDWDTFIERHYSSLKPIIVDINHHQDIAQLLANNCPCPNKITKESFEASYPLWNQVDALHSNIKNELLQKLLDKVNDANYPKLRGAIACLIAAGADVDQTSTYWNECALKRAAMYQDYPMAKFLLNKGANPNRKVDHQPLFFWLKSERFAKLFLSYNLDIHAKNEFSNTSIIDQLTYSHYPPSLITFYSQRGVRMYHKDGLGNTPLMNLAANSSHYGENNVGQLLYKAQILLANGLCVTETNNYNTNLMDILKHLLCLGNFPATHALKEFLENYSPNPVEEISHLFHDDE